MRFPRLTGLAIASLIVMALFLSACTRTATTPSPTAATGQTPAALTGQQATMEAVRSALLTQTAQAAAGSGAATSTPLVVVTQGTPSGSTPAAGTPQATNASTSAAATTCGPTSYTVLSGEWVYSIARKFGVDPQAIIDLNGLAAPYELSPGQSLKIPGSCPGGTTPVVVATVTPGGPTITPGGTAAAGGTSYTVQAGEWVYSIARKFGVDPQAIIDANNLQPPYTLSVGQKLIIPAH
jgi:LysM repeat protein